MRTRRRVAVATLFVSVLAALIALLPGTAFAVERIVTFDATYDVNADGSILVTEHITWDFEASPHHGIIRDLVTRQHCPDASSASVVGEPRTYDCPSGSDRVYDIRLRSVTADGGGVKIDVSDDSSGKHIKIGDANRTITGAHDYVITYELRGALDTYASFDELYWNATGANWSVPMESARVVVRLPGGGQVMQSACYEGRYGTNIKCSASASANTVTFTAGRTLYPGEQATIAIGFPHGVVQVPPPIVKDRVSIDDFFAFDPVEFGGMALTGVLALGAVVATWWRHGRDRAYRTLYYLTNDPTEGPRRLFARRDIVVEFLPPDDLRPAEMGVLLDERADTLDVTATIVDLAVRGYLHITEIPKKGWFAKKDWQLEQLKAGNDLLPYERELFDSLFSGSKQSVKVSSLRYTFADDLQRVKKKLYTGAVDRHWFSRSPDAQRGIGVALAIGVIVLGAGATAAAGWFLGRALIGVPIVVAGLIMLPLARAMAKRTATGSEALRRVLGFRLYVATAETRQQEFNEQANIFARYLPYAIVFGCVDKWARAFKGLEQEAANSAATWYTGVTPFHAAAFAGSMQSFSSSVGSTISATKSSGSGGGGFSGGGGGGGGGSSW